MEKSTPFLLGSKMANNRKHEAFNKIHSLWLENYKVVSIPFINITKEERKKKIIDLLKEMIGKDFHLNDKQNICEAISKLSFYRKMQIIAINKIEQDVQIFKKEMNESSRALIGFETIRLYENAKYDRVNVIKKMESDVNYPSSQYKRHFDHLYSSKNKLLDSMIHINKAKANSQVICKLVKSLTCMLQGML